MKKIIIVLFIGLIAAQVRAVEIGYFPGLKQLIDKSDAIVILRIDEHIKYQINPTLYSTHLCYIYQTLKGNIPKNTRIPIRLMDTQDSFVTPFSFHSTHLIFLTKKRTENEPTEYRTIQFEGANIILSPFGNEKTPEGKTVEQKVKNLIKNAIAYQAKECEKRQKFLKTILGQQKDIKQKADTKIIPQKVVSPKEKGIMRAKKDIAANKMKILYYGKPWSHGKPLIDDESGLPVEIVAGCCITPALWEETDAYNKTMRQEMKDKRKN